MCKNKLQPPTRDKDFNMVVYLCTPVHNVLHKIFHKFLVYKILCIYYVVEINFFF